MNRRLELIFSAVLTLCAVGVASTAVYQQLRGVGADTTKVSYTEGWDRLLSNGSRIGEASAPVQIAEFTDFECPFCQRFHRTLEQVAEELPGQVSTTFFHFPLEMHEFAKDASIAAECARRQGHFPEMVSELFARRDSFGVRPWAAYAEASGVSDTAAFRRCMIEDEVKSRIEADMAFGREIGVTGTPTIIINGWRLPFPVGADSLMYLSREFIAGRSPFKERD